MTRLVSTEWEYIPSHADRGRRSPAMFERHSWQTNLEEVFLKQPCPTSLRSNTFVCQVRRREYTIALC